MEDAAEFILMWGVVPLWVLAGLADWWCHRRTAIERTSGWRENAFHWVLFAEAGVALGAAALLEPDAAVLMLAFAAFLAHEATTYIELRYTVPLREVRPLEQMIHSFMEILPLLLLALLAVMGSDQALVRSGADVPDFGLRAREDPWPPAYLAGAAAAVLLFNVLPMAEEG
ncbi:MAG TPA: diguanylate cyclase, partial [Ramlibacter sp.]